MELLFWRSLINKFGKKKKKKKIVSLWKPRQDIPSLLPNTKNCQVQPCSPIKKFGLRKYDHIPEGLKSLGWLDIPCKLNFYYCKMMYR